MHPLNCSFFLRWWVLKQSTGNSEGCCVKMMLQKNFCSLINLFSLYLHAFCIHCFQMYFRGCSISVRLSLIQSFLTKNRKIFRKKLVSILLPWMVVTPVPGCFREKKHSLGSNPNSSYVSMLIRKFLRRNYKLRFTHSMQFLVF